MSAYDNDPRVTSHDDGSFTVVATRRIKPLAGQTWEIVPVEGWGTPDIHEDADEAVRSLIGNPQ